MPTASRWWARAAARSAACSRATPGSRRTSDCFPGVLTVMEYVPPQLHNDLARRQFGVDGAGASVAFPFEGQGQTVGVADTGLDDRIRTSRDGSPVSSRSGGRRPRIRTGMARTSPARCSATARPPAGRVRGAAPEAQLYFQSLLDASGRARRICRSTSPTSSSEAYQAGARIHNNSWGADRRRLTRSTRSEVDEFVGHARETCSSSSPPATRARRRTAHTRSRDSSTGYRSARPASCKNALTVGASRSKRNDGGLSSAEVPRVLAGRLSEPPIATREISGNTEALAAFSSRGPCDDRAHQARPRGPGHRHRLRAGRRGRRCRSSGDHIPDDAQYAYMGGTSMAAPLVAGCAAIVREYYVTTARHRAERRAAQGDADQRHALARRR